MQALVLHDRQLTFDPDRPPPIPAPGEALVRVTLAGICATDLELVNGYYPFSGVPGHEFVGVVAACDDRAWVGRRVVGTINISPACGGACGRRCPEHCPDRVVLGIVNKDGAFADWLTLPTANLLVVPDGVSDRQAVFAEPLAAALRLTEQIAFAARRCAVIGPGRLGLLIAQVLQHAGADVTVFGRTPAGLRLPQALGLSVAPTTDETPAAFDVVVEATGNPAGLQQALARVRPNGTIALKSTYADVPGQPLFANGAALLAQIVVNEITLVGSRCGPFAPALAALAAGTLQVEPLIDGEYRLCDGLAAFAHAAQPGVRKLLLRP